MIGTDISTAKTVLSNNKLVAIPTETVYGLAANALDQKAVTSIFEVKNRPSFDPLIVHIGQIEDVNRYANKVPEVAFQLAKEFWPGPLTLILEKSKDIPYIVTSGNETVGLRMPNHPLTLELLRSLDFPLAAPSANPFGYVSPTTAQHVADQLGPHIEYILDGGACQVGVESTIVKCTGNRVEILRLGGLPVESIEACLGRKVDDIQLSSSNPQAPGMLSSHYSPRKKLIYGNVNQHLESYHPDRVGFLWFDMGKEELADSNQRILSKKGNLAEAASNLFKYLRELDALDIDVILAESLPDEGLGKAINDRLMRASSL